MSTPAPRQSDRVNFVRGGGGPPLVLIHGIGHRWQAWEPVLDLLSDHHEVVALDLPGFGDSPVPAGGMQADLGAAATRVASFVTGLGLDRPHVAGNSLGGAIALELAVAGQAASATAISPSGFGTRAQRVRAIGRLAALRATTFLPAPVIRRALRSMALCALCFGPLVARPDRLSYERMLGDARAFRLGRGFWPTARAAYGYRLSGTPTVPVTVAWPERDRIHPGSQADRARADLPRARHVLLPGCGHVPMSDDPRLVADTILTTTGARTR
jgi:pimeloyl-ACP methyl ester carboxylesterase